MKRSFDNLDNATADSQSKRKTFTSTASVANSLVTTPEVALAWFDQRHAPSTLVTIPSSDSATEEERRRKKEQEEEEWCQQTTSCFTDDSLDGFGSDESGSESDTGYVSSLSGSVSGDDMLLGLLTEEDWLSSAEDNEEEEEVLAQVFPVHGGDISGTFCDPRVPTATHSKTQSPPPLALQPVIASSMDQACVAYFQAEYLAAMANSPPSSKGYMSFPDFVATALEMIASYKQVTAAAAAATSTATATAAASTFDFSIHNWQRRATSASGVPQQQQNKAEGSVYTQRHRYTPPSNQQPCYHHQRNHLHGPHTHPHTHTSSSQWPGC